MNVLLHVLEGRMRLKIREVKGSPAEAIAVESRLRELDGIHHVTANPLTGSVLVLYDSELSGVEAITATLRAGGYLSDPVPAASTDRAIAGGLGHLVLRATTEVALQHLIVALI